MTLALYQVLSTQYVARTVESLRAPRSTLRTSPSPLRAPHSALRTSPSPLRALLLLLALVTGCSPTNVTSEVYEPSLDEQLRSVLSGQSDEIVSAAALADDDLAVIEKATALRILIVENQESRITARGIQSLANLPNLEHLRLRGPGVDDAALAEIAK